MKEFVLKSSLSNLLLDKIEPIDAFMILNLLLEVCDVLPKSNVQSNRLLSRLRVYYQFTIKPTFSRLSMSAIVQ